MKKFMLFLASTLKRIFLSKSFWASCFGITGLNLLSVYQEITLIKDQRISVLYFYEISNHVNFWVLFLLLAALPSAPLFCVDWENRYFRAAVCRCTKRTYGAATSCACFISTLLTVTVGEWLFLLVLRTKYPFFLEEHAFAFSLDTSPFSPFLDEGKILIYFAFGIMTKSLSAAFFSVFSLWFSTKIPNIFVALTSPVIVFFVWENLGSILKFPALLQISTVSKGHIFLTGLLQTFLYPVILFGGMSFVFGLLFMQSVRRRIEDG